MIDPALAVRPEATARGDRPADVTTGERPAGSVQPLLSDRVVAGILGAASLVLFAVAIGIRLNNMPLGDEPHYLIIGQALAKYHSFDPTPVYANRDYWSYYPHVIEAHMSVGGNGRPIPTHNFGGPLLWLLPFMLLGRLGAHLVVLAASVLLVVNVYYLQRDLGIRPAYAAFVTGLCTIGTPLYTYSSMLFIEPIGALFVLYAVRVLLASRPRPVRLALASAGLGYLPWVHGRLAVFTVVLGALLIFRVVSAAGRRSVWPYLAGLVPMGILVAGIETFNALRYGTLHPAPGNANLGEGLFQIGPHEGLAYLLLDSTFGLFPRFPLLALALPGLLLAVRHGPARVHVVLGAAVLPYVVAVSSFGAWHGGFSPPARFLAVVTPILAYYVAVPLQRTGDRVLPSVAAGAALFAFAMSVAADIGLTERFHHFVALQQRFSFVSWAIGLGVFTVIVWRAGRTPKPSTVGQ